ncbi:class I SAM-dependent DNA methyltransferase [Rhodococcus triatomae]|nr:SAM dependent methyltransferase [Rhodococcus triatomae BKS 15-14]
MTRLPDDYFTRLYARSSDPWSFETRWYESRKRALTVAMLPRERFRQAFEPGCSIGSLTEVLAPRCDRLVATDVVESALEATRARLDRAGHTNTSVERWALGDPWPEATFDLIVLSEVCYYVEPDDLERVLDDAVAHLDADGVVLAVHWRHPVADYFTTGDEVHDTLRRHVGLTRTARYEDEDVLIETFGPASAPHRSVARREGLVE